MAIDAPGMLPPDAPDAVAATMCVTVVFAPMPRQVLECILRLPAGALAFQAVAQSGYLLHLPAQELDALSLAVWGRKIHAQHTLVDGDRLEILRPLTVDPKVARRTRFARQGARTAGLFAQRRPGSKAGY